MSTETTTVGGFVGGFVGDPAEAFDPPAAGGCCGSAPATGTASSSDAGTCCGSAEAAAEAGCAPAAKAEAVEAGAGCCG